MKDDLTRAKLPLNPPKYLGDYGKQIWQYIIPFLNKNKKVIRADQYLAAQYCSAYDVYRQAYENVKKEGIQSKKFKTTLNPVNGDVVAHDFTGYAKNPSVQAMSDALNKMNTIGKELGLSPKSRNELINLKEPKKKKKENVSAEMKKFFSK